MKCYENAVISLQNSNDDHSALIVAWLDMMHKMSAALTHILYFHSTIACHCHSNFKQKVDGKHKMQKQANAHQNTTQNFPYKSIL